jgi:sister-chromatid-cohesion protein PDS5
MQLITLLRRRSIHRRQAHYAARYNIFFYCNATAFVASLVIIVLLLSSSFSFHGYRVRALQAAMLLDLLGLMGAFTAGSCRKVSTSAYVVALVGAVVAYLAAHLVLHFWVRSNRCPSGRREVVELLNLHPALQLLLLRRLRTDGGRRRRRASCFQRDKRVITRW